MSDFIMSEIDPATLAELLREAMREGKLPFLTVVSNSMSPLIRRGDQIRLAPTSAEQLQPGDIIVYLGPANLITHRYWGRLLEKGETWLVTRGDRPQHFDRPFTSGSLVGQVIGRRRKQHVLNLASGVGKWLNNQLANLARLEIRLFSAPLALSTASQVYQLPVDKVKIAAPPAGGGPLSRSSNGILTRLIRRFLYSWAIILTVIISVIALAFSKDIED
ncbi:MAG: signal peptidase I [Candidatus Promineifilaceae bacterium]